jgi:CHAP domain-containing protein
MKKTIQVLLISGVIPFLAISFANAQAAVQVNQPLIIPNKTLSVVIVEGKKFLSLIPETAPENMFWGDFGSEIESYYGVVAYSNGARKTNRKYQCTELIHRFLTSVYGITSGIELGLGHGKDLAKNIAERFELTLGNSDTLGGYTIRLENFENKQSVYPPVVGSIVSMHFNSKKTGYGHVAIIRDIIKNEDGSLKATLFDQHGFIHKKANLPIQPDVVFFKKDSTGNWYGEVYSWLYKRKYPVVSWTNAVIVRD